MNPLPYILAQFTGERYLPKIVWSNKSWVHNTFRVYELLFWRKVGVRREMTHSVGFINGRQVNDIYQFHTLEAMFAHVEMLVRGKIPKRFPVRVYFPKLALSNSMIISSPYLFAVAFDATGSGTGGTGSVTNYTFNHTCTGSNIALTAGTQQNATTDPSGITYNSSAMTKKLTVTGGQNNSLWHHATPATGTNTVSVTYAAGTTYTMCDTASYTGVNATIGGTNTAHDDTGTNPNVTVSVTTTVANSYLACSVGANGMKTMTPSGSTVVRLTQDLGAASLTLFALELSTPTVQSNAIGGTLNSANSWQTCAMELTPATAGTTTARRRVFKHH